MSDPIRFRAERLANLLIAIYQIWPGAQKDIADEVEAALRAVLDEAIAIVELHPPSMDGYQMQADLIAKLRGLEKTI